MLPASAKNAKAINDLLQNGFILSEVKENMDMSSKATIAFILFAAIISVSLIIVLIYSRFGKRERFDTPKKKAFANLVYLAYIFGVVCISYCSANTVSNLCQLNSTTITSFTLQANANADLEMLYRNCSVIKSEHPVYVVQAKQGFDAGERAMKDARELSNLGFEIVKTYKIAGTKDGKPLFNGVEIVEFMAALVLETLLVFTSNHFKQGVFIVSLTLCILLYFFSGLLKGEPCPTLKYQVQAVQNADFESLNQSWQICESDYPYFEIERIE